ncbi:glycerol kinase GlpK [Nitrincola nitratireducens]|uniref:glycerol kinase n=1 Tax=Nitrincola nitratireducens TaxID=1229521 RepID=W9UYZ8_9GAMM|nr:glycerol kinase GlpK [Nitrincola nitratireducens]EXJ12458.1 Glycerol kinase [Nitrincola nitratireducens]
MTDYILAIDQGTTSSRAILYTKAMEVVATAQEEFQQHFPRNGWVEHDPEDLWQTVLSTCRAVLAKSNVPASAILTIGITNQRETSVIWDKKTGEPVYNAIVWQDRRSSQLCQTLKAEGLEPRFQAKTGLLLDPYFSGTKINWVLNTVKNARERAEAGDLCFGTVDSFLLWRFSKGRMHATDATNASRTLVFNIHTQTWDKELLDLLQIPVAMMPRVLNSADNFGVADAQWLGAEIPISSMIGDQQSALVGQACLEPGMLKSTYGTGCFAIVNTGNKAITSQHRLLTTVAYRVANQTTYAIEGSIFMAGAIIQWLRDGVGILKSSADSEVMSRSIRHDQSEIMVPAFTGLGAPYWDPDARAAIFGMTRDTGAAQLVAAAIRSVAFQTEDLLRAMAQDAIDITSLRVDGGMVENRWFLQVLADLTGIPVVKSHTAETTAKGAALLAAYQMGLFSSLEEMSQTWKVAENYQPSLIEDVRAGYYDRWLDAVSRVKATPEAL